MEIKQEDILKHLVEEELKEKTKNGKDLEDRDIKAIKEVLVTLKDILTDKSYIKGIDAFIKNDNDYIRKQWGMLGSLFQTIIGKIATAKKSLDKI